MNAHATPEGYWKDGKGNLVPESKVKPQHKLEDELVRRLCSGAASIEEVLANYKDSAFNEVEQFLDLLAQEYDTAKGGKKGNVTLSSYDGSFRVRVAVGDQMSFGPELNIAKDLIDTCVERWSEGSNDNIRALVEHAFQVNKVGRIDTQRVLGLRRLDIDDPDWNRAMDALSDAVRVVSSKRYLRVYRVEPETGAETQIALDIAGV